jgi:hypothetical protein
MWRLLLIFSLMSICALAAPLCAQQTGGKPVVGAKTGSSQSKFGPTLKETTDWLAGNLNAGLNVAYKRDYPTNGNGWTDVRTLTASHIQSASPLSFQGCTATLQLKVDDRSEIVNETTFTNTNTGASDGSDTSTQTWDQQSSGTVTFSLKDLTLPVRTQSWNDTGAWTAFIGQIPPTDTSQPPNSFVSLPAHGSITRRSVSDSTCLDLTRYHSGCAFVRVPEHKEDQDQYQLVALQFYFYDDDLTARVIRALNHAGELCGAKKSPF